MGTQKSRDGIRVGTGLLPHEEIIIYPPGEDMAPDSKKIPPPKTKTKKTNNNPKTRRKH